MKKISALVLITTIFFSFTANATVHEIAVVDNAFNPSNLNVVVGDTIKWSWEPGAMNHTTTSLAVPPGALPWDAPINESSPTFSYKVMVPGTYNYECTIHSGMTGSFTASSGTAIDMTEAPAELLIYPNPATTNFTIEYILPASAAPARIAVYNPNGEVVYAHELPSGGGVLRETISTGNFAQGIYMVRIVSGMFDRVEYIMINRP